ncbi:CDP-alcohol phosphatidyltransferase family protein [Nocardioides litoris]|uniref:CDP-alcohol phosphatidyltransferase family protein n=1 Tax=Nocardioides litoris TaxID=1926648 RepID=UPI0014773A71|nr:CDP-alcohol phosphatidyltransferase family protein [Nocardioides litoris]
MPDGPDAYDAWSERHGGLDPRASGWVRGWIGLTDGVAAPLARWGVPADAVTVAGLAVTAVAPLLARRPGAGPWLVVPTAIVAGVLDGVDGAVASRAGSSGRRGQVLDAATDRVSDVLLAAVPVALGAPRSLGVGLAVVGLAQEGLRVGRGSLTVTVSERPTRVSVACTAAALAAFRPARRRSLATAVAAGGLGLGLVGLGQLVAARRAPRSPGSPPSRG